MNWNIAAIKILFKFFFFVFISELNQGFAVGGRGWGETRVQIYTLDLKIFYFTYFHVYIKIYKYILTQMQTRFIHTHLMRSVNHDDG